MALLVNRYENSRSALVAILIGQNIRHKTELNSDALTRYSSSQCGSTTMPQKKPEIVDEPETYIALVAHFLDFLIVCVHTILYERAVYPRESFAAVRRYNYPVRHSRVPDVREWINEAIDAIEPELLKCNIEKICLVIYSRFDDPLERFVFDLSRFPEVAKRDWHVPFFSTSLAEKARLKASKIKTINMDQQFRAVMTRLQFMQRELEPLPSQAHWNISIDLRDDADAPDLITQKNSPWIPIEPSLQRELAHDERPTKLGDDLGGLRTTPIRNIEAGEMVFEMWVEEGAAKIDAIERQHFAEEYDKENAVELPGFNVQPRIEKFQDKGKHSDTDDCRNDHQEDEFNDGLENMSQYSFLAGD